MNKKLLHVKSFLAGIFLLLGTQLGFSQISSISVSPPAKFCGASTENLSSSLTGAAVGNLTYSWSSLGDGTFSSTTSSNPTYTPGPNDISNGSVQLSVTVEDDGDNSSNSSGPIIISVYTLPAITAISNSGAACEGVAIDLTATTVAGSGAISSYTWTGSNGFSANTEDATISNPENAHDGVYTLTIEDANGCSASSTTTVTVYKKPAITAIANSGAACEGVAIDLTATTAVGDAAISTFSWAGANGFAASTEDASISSPVNANDGDYTLTIEDANGCSASSTTTVTVYKKPAITTIANSGAACEGVAIDLTATTAVGDAAISTFSWTGANGFAASTEDASISSPVNANDGDYTLTIEDANGCSASSTTTVTVYKKPAITAIANSGAACEGVAIDLTATTAVGDGAISTFSWTGANGFAASTEDASISSPVNANDGDYTLTIEDANGCSASSTTTVTVYKKPAITAIANSGAACEGVAIDLTATTAIGDAAISTFSWAGANGFVASTEDASISSPVNANDGDYTLTIEDANGCSASSTTTVTVYKKPAITAIANSGAACEGVAIDLTATTAVGDGAISTFSWAGANGFAASTEDASISSPVNANDGDYTLTIEDANGCSASSNTTVTVYKKPAITAIANSGAACEGVAIDLTATTAVGDGAISTFSWTGSNGFSATTEDATISNPVNANDGVYTLAIEDANGCSASSTTTVTVYLKPSASFSITENSVVANDAMICSDASADFDATASVGDASLISSYQWFRNSSAAGTGASTSFSTAGDYHLVVTDNLGCTQTTATQTLTVFTLPGIGITANDATQCINGNTVYGSNSFDFTSTNTTNIANYAWNMGDGVGTFSGASNSSITNYVYGSEGNYSVNLQLTDNNGCQSSTNLSVSVYPKPVVDFATAVQQKCLTGNSFPFTNSTTLSNGAPVGGTTYAWTFGDGSSSTQTSPTKTYSTEGHYTVYMQATTVNGCLGELTRTSYIDVWPMPNNVVGTSSTLSGDPGVNGGQLLCNGAVVFTNASTISEGSIVNYRWDFGDGSPVVNTASTDILKHEFPFNSDLQWFTPGYPNTNYAIHVRSTSDRGCITNTTFTRAIKNGPEAIVNLTSDQTQCLTGNSFELNNHSQNHWPSFTTHALWDHGDGTTNTATSIEPKVFTQTGTFRTHLIMYAGSGCTDTAYIDLTVNPAPVISFTHDAACSKTVNFNSSASTGVTGYSWNFGDGNTSTSANPTHTYSTGGSYTVTLTTTTGGSCSTGPLTLSQTVVPGNEPVVAFSETVNSCNNAISFTNTSTAPVGALTYSWDFGDGNTSTSATPTHNYAADGTYDVELTATSSTGCNTSLTTSISATAFNSSGLDADFTVTQADLCVNTISIANTTNNAGVATTYEYSLDNAAFASVSSFPLSLSGLSNGSHSLILKAIDGGCTSTKTKTFTVNNDVNVDFSVGTQSACNPAIQFSNSSTGTGTLTYSWDFGDGNSSTSASPSHTYASINTFDVTLTVTNTHGCSKELTKQAVVGSLSASGPSASFTKALSGTCGNTYTFTNTSTGSPVTYLWNFGDGKTTNTQDAVKSFGAGATYTVTLTATDVNGCSSSSSQTVTIGNDNYGPMAYFEIENAGSCGVGANFSFLNRADHSGAGWIPSSLWSFGDGTTSTQTFVFGKTFASTGDYTVTLTVTNQTGCTSTFSRKLRVGTSPTADFTPVYDGCTKNVSFTNTSTSGSGITYSWNLGNGTTSTQMQPSTSYASTGNYNVTLTVDNLGCSSSITKTVSVASTPVSSFTYGASSCASNIAFDNNSTVDYGNLTYSWDFGDGTTSTLENPVKAYALAGSYTVTLTVYNGGNCSHSSSQVVNAPAGQPAPNASFTSSGSFSSCSNQFTFTNTSTSSGTPSYSWNFGDGSTSTTANPTHTYNSSGSYTVSLTVDDGTCSSTYSSVVNASNGNNNPIVGFTTTNAAQCISTNRFDFFNTTYFTGWGWVNDGYTWDFGDGTGSTHTFPNGKVYATPGTYTVTLNAVSNMGCTGSYSMVVTVVDLPCSGLSVVAKNDLPGNKTGFDGFKEVGKSATGLSSRETEVASLTLYPNPNTGNFNIDLSGITTQKPVQVSIVDMLGRVVYEQNSDVRMSNEIEIRNLSVEPGKYHVIISEGTKVIGRSNFAVYSK